MPAVKAGDMPASYPFFVEGGSTQSYIARVRAALLKKFTVAHAETGIAVDEVAGVKRLMEELAMMTLIYTSPMAQRALDVLEDAIEHKAFFFDQVRESGPDPALEDVQYSGRGTRYRRPR